MAGKFVVFKGKDGQDYFRLKAGNGEVILSSEGYKSRVPAPTASSRCVRIPRTKTVSKSKPPRTAREYFILKAGNGQEIGRSQMYKSGSGCRNGMKSVARNAADAAVVEE